MALYFLKIVTSSGLDIKRSMDFIDKFIFGVLFQKIYKKVVISFILPGTNYLYQTSYLKNIIMNMWPQTLLKGFFYSFLIFFQ